MPTIKLSYDKPRKNTYDIFVNNIKTNKKDNIDIKQDVELVEQNIALSNWWFFLIFVNIILCFFGGAPEDWKSVKSERKRIRIAMHDAEPQIIININSMGEISKIDGVKNFQVLNSFSEPCPKAVLRVKRYKYGLIIGSLTIITLIMLALVFTMLF